MVQWSRLDDDHWGPFGFIMYFCLWYLHTFSGNSHTWSAKIAVMCWLLQVWRGCNVVTFVCCSFLLHRRKNLSTFELINRWNKWMNETRRKVHNLANMKLWQEWALKQLALRRWFRYVSVLQQFDFYCVATNYHTVWLGLPVAGQRFVHDILAGWQAGIVLIMLTCDIYRHTL